MDEYVIICGRQGPTCGGNMIRDNFSAHIDFPIGRL